MSDHNFLPNTNLNTFSNWSHAGGNLAGQSSGAHHHILDHSSHLIDYSQHHHRGLPHLSITSQGATNYHQTSQPLDNLNLMPHHLDGGAASYNLSTLNENQLYNSQYHTKSASFLISSERSTGSLSNHQAQLTYHNSIEPTTSSQHLVSASSSGGGSSSNKTGSSAGGSSSFRCSTCNEVFPLRTVYQSHLKTHTKQEKSSKPKFQCELCGHSFSQKTSLNRHMKSHTGERPFPCEICAKAFSEKERLKIHMRTHTGEKPFSCGVCGKSFSQKSTVKRHQTVHTGEKKFRCDCGKGFANRGNLIAHIKTRAPNHGS